MELHPKQIELIETNKRFAVLNWGRRCFVGGTPVVMSDGTSKQIKHVVAGDVVLSFNTKTKQVEEKEVVETYNFGVDFDPKPMLKLVIDGKVITSTYDHEYYYNHAWIPAYQLAWGTMDNLQRLQLKLLCEQYGELTDDFQAWWEKNGLNETSERRLRLHADGYGWKDSESPSYSGSELDKKPSKQTASEPQERDKRRQQSGEFGMGDTQREYSARHAEQPSSTEQGGEKRDKQTNEKRRGADKENTETISEEIESRFVKGTFISISTSQSGNHKRCFEGKNLVAYCVKVLPCQESYDLSVECNHNYFVDGILVHNSGKTTGIAYKALPYLWNKDNARVAYYAPTRSDARDIAWDIFKDTYKDLIVDTNETYLELKVRNKTGGTSLLVLTGWEAVKNSDKGRGVENDLVILDECAFYPAFEKYEKVIEPTLLTTKGSAIFTSTPNGFNHFYELCQKAQNNDYYFYSHATSYDNPFNPVEELERLKQEKTEDGFAQEYMADFRKKTGLVYKEFDRRFHLTEDIPEAREKLGAVDFGFTNPSAILTIEYGMDKKYYVTEELYRSGMTHEAVADYVAGKQYQYVYPDPASPEAIEVMRKKAINIRDVNKARDSIPTGINMVRELLKTHRLKIHPSCVNLIFELENYSYPDDNKDRNANELPVKLHDHALDALRYAIMTHQPSRSSKTFHHERRHNQSYYSTQHGL